MTDPQFPLYIVSYDRAENCRTPRFLDRIGVPYRIVVESEQFDDYASIFGPDRTISVPDEYHERYDTYDDLGRDKSQGPGPARNFAWEHSQEQGYNWHWVMDDNISKFLYYTDNREIPIGDGTVFRAMEDFARKFENISMAGPRYQMFNIKRQDDPPLTLNTRVYSCNLIRNDAPFEWAGRYNEDTDLSLRMLKSGWCTAIFNLFLQKKRTTQRLDGGNTENLYAKEGTYPKSAMLKRKHPEVTDLTRKWGRWHHEVDYTPFKKNKLKRKDNPNVDTGDYNYTIVDKG